MVKKRFIILSYNNFHRFRVFVVRTGNLDESEVAVDCLCAGGDVNSFADEARVDLDVELLAVVGCELLVVNGESVLAQSAALSGLVADCADCGVVFLSTVGVEECNLILDLGSCFKTFASTGVFDFHAFGSSAVGGVAVAVEVGDVGFKVQCSVAVVFEAESTFKTYVAVFVVGTGCYRSGS